MSPAEAEILIYVATYDDYLRVCRHSVLLEPCGLSAWRSSLVLMSTISRPKWAGSTGAVQGREDHPSLWGRLPISPCPRRFCRHWKNPCRTISTVSIAAI